jgi:competence protein ComEA
MIWKRIARDYFTFNKRESRGVYSLVILLLVLCCLHLGVKFYPLSYEKYSEEDLLAFRSLSESISYSNKNETLISATSSGSSASQMESIDWHSFDPNKADTSELIELGLKPWMAARIIKYREKVRPFESAEDLKKVYNIDIVWLQQAFPYIEIDQDFAKEALPVERGRFSKENQSLKDSSEFVLIDLNTADTNLLKSIPGIGSFYAKQIVELRERYGGFRSFDQLLGLYKVRDETLTILSEKTVLDTSSVKRIDLNSCSLKELGRHPYLSWKQARIIMAYREQHQGFRSVKEILRTDVITDSVYLKIAPYLMVK